MSLLMKLMSIKNSKTHSPLLDYGIEEDGFKDDAKVRQC